MDNIGAMRERIRLATRQVTRDSLGGEEETWSLSNSIWAKVEYLTTGSDERFSSDRKVSLTAANFTIRNRSVSIGQQIEYRGDRYNIESILPQHANAYLLIETRKVEPQ
ncbi:MAG: phage head closure protein [Bacteroidota bacterium]